MGFSWLGDCCYPNPSASIHNTNMNHFEKETKRKIQHIDLHGLYICHSPFVSPHAHCNAGSKVSWASAGIRSWAEGLPGICHAVLPKKTNVLGEQQLKFMLMFYSWTCVWACCTRMVMDTHHWFRRWSKSTSPNACLLLPQTKMKLMMQLMKMMMNHTKITQPSKNGWMRTWLVMALQKLSQWRLSPNRNPSPLKRLFTSAVSFVKSPLVNVTWFWSQN